MKNNELLIVKIIFIIICYYLTYLWIDSLPSYNHYCIDFDDKKYKVRDYIGIFSSTDYCNKNLICNIQNKKIQMKKCWKEEAK